MVVLPAATPPTTPAETVPLAVFVLLHTPPPDASVNVSAEPTHTAELPEMLPAAGNGLTVTTTEEEQPPIL